METPKQPSYWQLFIHFFRIGVTAFGGLAMTAHIRKHIVDKKHWMDPLTFDAGLAICQVIPGAIVMQLAAYVGLKLKGIRGAILSFIGFGLPAFLIMFILSVIYKHSKNISGVEMVLQGLRVIIVAIIANAAFTFGKKNLNQRNDWIIAILSAGLFLTKLHPALVLIISAFLGILLTNKEIGKPKNHGKSRTFRFFLILLVVIAVCAGVLFLLKPAYFTMATLMLRIDLISFGGGLAAMPIMYHELVDLFGWFDDKTFMDGMILGQVTPGSIIIAATFFGYLHFGITGSILATICIFTPSFMILMGIVPFFDKLSTYPQFNKVLNGILCSFVGLLAIITFRFTHGIHWNFFNIALTLLAFILLLKKVDVIWIILGGVLISLFLH